MSASRTNYNPHFVDAFSFLRAEEITICEIEDVSGVH